MILLILHIIRAIVNVVIFFSYMPNPSMCKAPPCARENDVLRLLTESVPPAMTNNHILCSTMGH